MLRCRKGIVLKEEFYDKKKPIKIWDVEAGKVVALK